MHFCFLRVAIYTQALGAELTRLIPDWFRVTFSPAWNYILRPYFVTFSTIKVSIIFTTIVANKKLNFLRNFQICSESPIFPPTFGLVHESPEHLSTDVLSIDVLEEKGPLVLCILTILNQLIKLKPTLKYWKENSWFSWKTEISW